MVPYIRISNAVAIAPADRPYSSPIQIPAVLPEPPGITPPFSSTVPNRKKQMMHPAIASRLITQPGSGDRLP